MTFEEWWAANKQLLNEQQMTAMEAVAISAASAWHTATAAERQRCRELVVKYADRLRDEGYRLLDTIADEIGE